MTIRPPVMLNRTDQRLLRDAIRSVRRDGCGFIPSPYWAARINVLVADGLLERHRNEPWPLDHWAAFTYMPTRRGVRAYNAVSVQTSAIP